MVVGAYRDLFTAVAASAGALTGLLFVAVSVVPRRGGASGLDVVQQVRAAAALLGFTNALAISLYGLVPGTNAGYPAAVLGIIGLLFTAAGTRSILSSRTVRRQHGQQLDLIILLLIIFGVELAGGITLIADSHLVEPVRIIGFAIVSSLFVGIARAWELAGERDTGIRTSLAVLAGRTPGRDRTPPVAADDAADAGTGDGPEPDTAGRSGA